MEKKLYRVKVVLFVMAEDEAEACMRPPPGRASTSSNAQPGKQNMSLPEWDDAIPYNADDERTCAEILGNRPQTAQPETHLMKLPAYVEAAMRVFDQDNHSSQPGQQD
jgi:hypothetical protein